MLSSYQNSDYVLPSPPASDFPIIISVSLFFEPSCLDNTIRITDAYYPVKMLRQVLN